MRNMHKKTWILMADGHHARAWEWRNPDEPLSLVGDLTVSSENATSFSRDMKSDKPGRSFSSIGPRRSAMEPRHDPHELEKSKFAVRLAGLLDEAFHQSRFRQLILIAPPHMLGNLRNCLSDQISKSVIGEVDKDLMKADITAVQYHTAKFLTTI